MDGGGILQCVAVLQIPSLPQAFRSPSLPEEQSSKCPAFRHINLQYNRLTGPLPSTFGLLCQVNRIELQNNRLSGKLAVLETLASTTNIVRNITSTSGLRVDVRHNMFEGVLSESLRTEADFKFSPQASTCPTGFDRRQDPGNASNFDYGICAPFLCTDGEHRDSTSCKPCEKGFYSQMPERQDSPIACTACRGGHHAPTVGMTACSKCAAGLHQDRNGRVKDLLTLRTWAVRGRRAECLHALSRWDDKSQWKGRSIGQQHTTFLFKTWLPLQERVVDTGPRQQSFQV